MEKIGSFQAKTHLPQLLDRVAKGEQFTITKHGIPVAKLVPIHEQELRPPFDQLVATLEAVRARSRSGPESVKDLINEGRRF